MSRAYYLGEDRLRRLLEAGKRWMGTPCTSYSQVCGVGVSCHNLCFALHEEAGAFPGGLQSGLRGFGHRHVDAAEQWMDAFPYVERVTDGSRLPGDTIMLASNRIHFAVCFPDERNLATACEIIQCLGHQGVHLHSLADPQVITKTRAVWRIIEHG